MNMQKISEFQNIQIEMNFNENAYPQIKAAHKEY